MSVMRDTALSWPNAPKEGERMVSFKLDNADGEMVDLTRYSPSGFVSVPVDSSGLSGGGYFTIGFPDHEEVYRHLAAIYSLNTGQSQTYEYKRGSTVITGECFLEEIRHFGGAIKAAFLQTGPQVERHA